MKQLETFPALQRAIPVATGNKTRRIYYVRDTVLEKPRSASERRYKAFSNLVSEWLKDNLSIGTAVEEAICLVTHFHEELQNIFNENATIDVEAGVQDLSDALDYFESMMGNTFKLIR